MLHMEVDTATAVIKLDRNVINALNPEGVSELARTLQQVKSDPSVRALVLASANDKFFSIGFDIPSLFALAREEFLSGRGEEKGVRQ